MNSDEKLLKKIRDDLKKPIPLQTYESQQLSRFLSQERAIQKKMDRESARYDAISDEKSLQIQKLKKEIEELQFNLS